MYLLSITTDKMQRYTIFFIIVTALHVSGVFSSHHQELKNRIHSIWYVPGLLAATTNKKQRYTIFFIIVTAAATASGSSSKPGTYQMLCV
jgi:hypothetical protein